MQICSPGLSALRWFRARKGDEVRFGPSVQSPFVDPIWNRAFEGSLKPLSAKAFANSLHGGRGSLQHPGYLAVYEHSSFGVLSEVGLKQDPSTIEHPCRSGT